MMPRSLTYLGIVAMLLPTTHSGASVKVVQRGAAAQVVVARGVIVALDEDFQHVRGYDAAGRIRWRTRYQAKGEGRGIQALFAFAAEVLVYAGNRVRPIDPLSGRLSASNIEVPYLSSPGNPGCWLNHVNGACAYYCPCSFQFARCKDGSPLGRAYLFHYICKRKFKGRGYSCGCWGSDGDLVGRSGSILVARMDKPSEGRGKRRTYEDILVGVDEASGQEIWRRDAPIRYPATWMNGLGVCRNGFACWIGDSHGRLAVTLRDVSLLPLIRAPVHNCPLGNAMRCWCPGRPSLSMS